MEFSLHASLKKLFAGDNGKAEVRVGRFRVDALADGKIIEIETGPLLGVREKLRQLLLFHPVLVVKPIVKHRYVRWFDSAGQLVCHRQLPVPDWKLAFFDDLVYLTRVFPNPNLSLRFVLVSVEEHRLSPKYIRNNRSPGRGRMVDVFLKQVDKQVDLVNAADLLKLLPSDLPVVFDTVSLAELWKIEPWEARKILYCLRECGLVQRVGCRNRFRQYVLTTTENPGSAVA
ncbi:MAG: hypothetical protein NZ899_08615 [Thermoguttaceae bacterium]|nr:hypothetical protein [Thermoguttaceae bacterium]MDW8077993.1 hypothetical protein [Thermoguttaceae bacterium]